MNAAMTDLNNFDFPSNDVLVVEELVIDLHIRSAGTVGDAVESVTCLWVKRSHQRERRQNCREDS